MFCFPIQMAASIHRPHGNLHFHRSHPGLCWALLCLSEYCQWVTSADSEEILLLVWNHNGCEVTHPYADNCVHDDNSSEAVWEDLALNTCVILGVELQALFCYSIRPNLTFYTHHSLWKVCNLLLRDWHLKSLTVDSSGNFDLRHRKHFQMSEDVSQTSPAP